MVAFTKDGITLIELHHVPVRDVDAIGRIDVIGTKMIFTVYQMQPGDDGAEEAIVIDKLSFPISDIPDEIQFAIKVLAQVGRRILFERPMVLN